MDTIPFGQIGTVTGIIDGQIEVVFDNPFIGGFNLHGRCQDLKGAIVDFLSIYNLSSVWRECLHLVSNSESWNGVVPQF